MKSIIAGMVLPLFLSPAIALADENPLVGTWKLKTFVREVFATGKKYNLFGEHPNGYLSYSADGRMYAIATVDKRVKPRGTFPDKEERVTLHESMFAYAGTYTLEGDGKLVHHVDISWDELYTGTDQVRFYKLDGNTLSIFTAPFTSQEDGQARGILTWEKVKASAAK
jgi:Lipocalin-like domain